MKLPVTLTGTVLPGNHIGRQFDMPTANIIPEEEYSRLRHGVYYSVIQTEDESYPGITNLGTHPTVTDDGKVYAETYIYDFKGDLYGKVISVTLLEFRRAEKKFDSLDELYETVRRDFTAGRIYHNLSDRSAV